VGNHEGLPFLALEFVDGGSLADKLGGQPLPPRLGARLVETLAHAMHWAHSRNVVHRDLKPANVLITGDDIPKVTDFGLARQLDIEGGQTHTNAVMGTPSYMAPEQASGQAHAAGPPADVYALGAILYACLTGQPPFKAPTALETMERVRSREPVPPSRLRKEVPRDLETICLKCLAKEPHRRYASAAEMADDLRRFREGRPVVARPVGNIERSEMWVRRNPVVAALLALILLAVLSGSAGTYWKYLDAKDLSGILTEKADALELTVGERDDAIKTVTTESDAKEKALKKAREEADAKDIALKQARREKDNYLVLTAQSDFEKGNVRVARQRLDEIDPQNRGFEWHYLRRQFDGGLFTMYGHSQGILGLGSSLAIAFSPDGKRLGSASNDGTIRIWDARTGEQVRVLRAHAPRDWGIALAFSPDGSRLVTACTDNVLLVWDANTGEQLQRIPIEHEVVRALSFSPDGSLLITAGSAMIARLRNSRSGRVVTECRGHKGWIRTAVFSPNGDRIVTGSDDNTGRIWDVQSGKELCQVTGHRGNFSGVAFSPDGERVVGGLSNDSDSVRVWDSRTGNSLRVFRVGQNEYAGSVAFSPDGSRVLASYGDRVRLWDMASGLTVLELRGHSAGIFSPDGSRIATSGSGTVKIWDARTGGPNLKHIAHAGQVFCGTFDPTGRYYLTGSGDRTARLWDTQTQELVREFNATSGVFGIAISPDGRRLITAGDVMQGKNRNARVWDVDTGEVVMDLVGHSRPVRATAYSPDGQSILTGSEDGTARLWDPQTGECRAEYRQPGKLARELDCVTFSPDGRRFAAAGQFTSAICWRVDTPDKPEFQLPSAGLEPGSVCFSPDGSHLVTGVANGVARIWDSRTGAHVGDLRGHTERVYSIAFTPDGNRIVTGSWDNTVRVWDAKTRQPLLELKGHDQWVMAVAVSSDGQRILSCGSDKAVCIWDARPLRSPPPFSGQGDDSIAATLNADCNLGATLARDGTMTVWDVRSGSPRRQSRQSMNTGNSRIVDCLGLNADGSRVASAEGSGVVKVWDTADGSVCYTNTVTTEDADGTVKVWNTAERVEAYTATRSAFQTTRLEFSRDGDKVRMGDKVLRTVVLPIRPGVKAEAAPDDFPSVQDSIPTDKDFGVFQDGSSVRVVSLQPTLDEKADRRAWTRFRFDLLSQDFASAKQRNDRGAMWHLINIALAAEPWDRLEDLQFRAKEFPERVESLARTRLHTPSAAGNVEKLITRMADLALQQPTPIHLRTLGGLLTREGKAEEGVEPLKKALAMRTSEYAPPVEELLLALAYHELKQPDEAKKWLIQAEAWIDQKRAPFEAASLVGKLATGITFLSLAPDGGVPLDPRYQWPLWESWYEMEVFRAEAVRKIRPQP